jgi:hypothetical protein
MVGGKQKTLGAFHIDCEREAAECYDAEKMKNGSFTKLNFPDSPAALAAIAAAGAVTIVPR